MRQVAPVMLVRLPAARPEVGKPEPWAVIAVGRAATGTARAVAVAVVAACCRRWWASGARPGAIVLVLVAGLWAAGQSCQA